MLGAGNFTISLQAKAINLAVVATAGTIGNRSQKYVLYSHPVKATRNRVRESVANDS